MYKSQVAKTTQDKHNVNVDKLHSSLMLVITDILQLIIYGRKLWSKSNSMVDVDVGGGVYTGSVLESKV